MFLLSYILMLSKKKYLLIRKAYFLLTCS